MRGVEDVGIGIEEAAVAVSRITALRHLDAPSLLFGVIKSLSQVDSAEKIICLAS